MHDKMNHELNPRISADCVIFGFDLNKLNVLLIERETVVGLDTYKALPGDLIFEDEPLDTAANRVLNELTGLENIYLEQVGAFGDPDRLSKPQDRAWLKAVRQDPDARVITVGYYSLVGMNDYVPQPASFARAATWIPIEEIGELAFDHREILDSALKKLKEKLLVQPIGFNLLPEKFTLSQLHRLYEAILGVELDKRNFRRKMLKMEILESLEERQEGVPHKPSQFFKFNEQKYHDLLKTGFDNFGF
jgi:8-oxo-dGTP diphosphatase